MISTEERARRLVEETWSGIAAGGDGWRRGVAALCEMAVETDPEAARCGAGALFGGVIERLNDSFSAEGARIYPGIFAQVIDFHRRQAEGRGLDEGLRRFGLVTEGDLVRRHERLLCAGRVDLERVRRVLLLSRVTIGADVAISSVLIDGLREALPEAEFVLLGSRKLAELYGGERRIRVREIVYARGGRVMSRLMSWCDVVEAVAQERRDIAPDGLLVIDPDSRLTQLGLLPVSDDDNGYRFFPSRSYQAGGAQSLGELAAAWVGSLTGASRHAVSFVALPAIHRERGVAIREGLTGGSGGRVITVSLGVGGNEEKRLRAETELEMIGELCRDWSVILDKGGSEEERATVERIVGRLAAEGVKITAASEQNWRPGTESGTAGLLTWDGGIGSFAGLIAASDHYLGYDSSGQHLAAALRVPATTIFITANPPIFIERWHPGGGTKVVVTRRESPFAELRPILRTN